MLLLEKKYHHYHSSSAARPCYKTSTEVKKHVYLLVNNISFRYLQQDVLFPYILARTFPIFLEREDIEEIFNISECYAWDKHVSDVQIEVA